MKKKLQEVSSKLADKFSSFNRGPKLLLQGVVVGVFAVIGVYVLGLSLAGTETTVSNCGARVANYSYKRPFGPNAPWNIPACEVPRMADADSREWVDRFWNYARSSNYSTDPNADRDPSHFVSDFGFAEDKSLDYSAPIYYATDKTPRKKIRLRNGYKGANTNIGEHETVPWDPSWKPSWGSDHYAIVLDEKTGTEWDLWAIADNSPGGDSDIQCYPGMTVTEYKPEVKFNLTYPYVTRIIPYNPATDLCVAGANVVKAPTGELANYKTYEGNAPASRGGGTPGLAMVPTPEEVKAGEIRHALPLMIYNSMFGPLCTEKQQQTADMWVKCGDSFAPAGQFESIATLDGKGGDGRPLAPGSTPDEIRSKTIPEGIRFALNLNDTEIENWLDSRDYQGKKRDTARIFARALRDYGWMVIDTTRAAASFQMAGSANPQTAAGWRDLGIDGDGMDLLHGLIHKDRIYTVAPPENICGPNKKSIYHCHASQSIYEKRGPGAQIPLPTPPQNKAPTVSLTINGDNNGTFEPHKSYEFEIAASDDGNISKVEIYNGTELVAYKRPGMKDFTGVMYRGPFKGRLPSMSNNKIYKYSAIATDNNNFKSIHSVVIRVGNTAGQAEPKAPTLPPQPDTGIGGGSAPVNTPPQITLRSPLAGQNISGSSVTATATASDAEGPVTVRYYEDAKLLDTSTKPPEYAVTIENLAAGPHKIRAEATDSAGAKTETATISYNVEAPPPQTIENKPPTVSLKAAPATGTAPASVVLTAHANDPDGSIVEYEFYENNSSKPFATNTTGTYRLEKLPAGKRSYKVRVLDNGIPAASATSKEVTISISQPSVSPKAPQAINGYLNFNLFKWHYGIVLKWSSANADDDIRSYTIRKNGGDPIVLSGTTTSFEDYDIAAGSSYTYDLTATNSAGNVSETKTFKATTQCTWIFCSLK